LLAYVKTRSRSDPELAQLGLELLRGLTGAFTVLVVTAFMLLWPPSFARVADWIAPEERRPRVRNAFASVTRRFQRWLRAQVILSLTIGLITFVGLLFLRVPYPHLLALVAAVGELIPVVGPVLAAIPAVIVAFSQSPEQVLWVIVLACCIQLFENYWLVPRVMHQVVGVPPLATIVGLLVGSELFGILGAILAVPVTAALGILIPEVAGALAAATPLSGRSPSAEAPKGAHDKTPPSGSRC
jgi:predicted PurR-regulated permease PerM